MDRSTWTDERLDDRFDSIDRELAALRTDIRELRTLMFQLWGSNMLAIVVSFAAVVVTRS